MVDVQTTQAREMSEAVESHRRRMAEIPTQSERNLARLDEEYKTLKEQVRTRYETKWNALAARWRDGMARVSAELAAVGGPSTRSARPGTIPPGPTAPCPGTFRRSSAWGLSRSTSPPCLGESPPTPG